MALTECYNISNVAFVPSFVSHRNVGAPPDSRPGLWRAGIIKGSGTEGKHSMIR